MGFDIENMPPAARRRLFVICMTVISIAVIVTWAYTLRFSIADQRSPEEQAKWEQIRRDFDALVNSTRDITEPLEQNTSTTTSSEKMIPPTWLTYTNDAFRFSFRHPDEYTITAVLNSTSSALVSVGVGTSTPLQFRIFTNTPTTTTGTYRWIAGDTLVTATDFEKSATTSLILSTFTILP